MGSFSTQYSWMRKIIVALSTKTLEFLCVIFNIGDWNWKFPCDLEASLNELINYGDLVPCSNQATVVMSQPSLNDGSDGSL
jgi:hypothetical protein